MTFYLRPPSGTTNIHSLQKSAITRLSFLLQLDATSGDPVKVHDLLTNISLVEESDYLIEGTRKDRISHYILRLAFAGKPELTRFLLRAESLLFEVRFLSMESRGIIKLLHSLDALLIQFDLKLNRHKTSESVDNCLSGLLGTFLKLWRQFGSWQSIVEKYFSGCQSEFMEIPFVYVLDLVRKRSVTLTHGMAFLPLAKLRLVAMALFEALLKEGLSDAKQRLDVVMDDVRMRTLFRKLHGLYKAQQTSAPNGRHSRRELSHTEVDTNVSFFPPCMSHLHRQLRKKHRLKHHSRIQYTLFLKEIGLPVHEAIMFWKQEYSLVSGDKKTCSHSWSQEEQRYTYNIRHLYGLEGSRVNYRGHCCKSLQDREFGHQEEGGCPFVRFDKNHMIDFLQSENIVSSCQNKILKSVARGDNQEACQTFLGCKTQERILCDQNKFSRVLLGQKVQEDMSMEIYSKEGFLCKTLHDLNYPENIDKMKQSLKLVKYELEQEFSSKILCHCGYSEHFCQKEMEPCQNHKKTESFPFKERSVLNCLSVKPQILTDFNELDQMPTILNMTSQESEQINKPLDFFNSLKLLHHQ